MQPHIYYSFQNAQCIHVTLIITRHRPSQSKRHPVVQVNDEATDCSKCLGPNAVKTNGRFPTLTHKYHPVQHFPSFHPEPAKQQIHTKAHAHLDPISRLSQPPPP
jgi:hypothetical protein